VADSTRYIVFDARLPVSRQPDETWLNDPVNLTSFVRSGMKRYVSHKYTRGQSTLIVYLLDPQIERILLEHQAPRTSEQGQSPPFTAALAILSTRTHQAPRTNEQGHSPLDENERNKILQAVRAEVGELSGSTSVPAILTTIDVRPALREILAPEFPRLPVLAYQELSPDMNIQPIARISLNKR
jgi:type III secretion protein V